MATNVVWEVAETDIPGQKEVNLFCGRLEIKRGGISRVRGGESLFFFFILFFGFLSLHLSFEKL